MAKKHSFLFRNSLSIVLISLLLISITAQFYTGLQVHNEERLENGLAPRTPIEYAQSGHFIQATFENWESEFLQMGLFVILTIFLRQKGSSESKGLDKPEPVDREPKVHPKAPWPVKKGGFWLALYKNSLSLAFFLLFIISFCTHFYGSLLSYNEEQAEKNLPLSSAGDYIANAQFWFESFQNWQSEFLAVAAIVLLSIWLRQKGSPESKPVDAAYYEDAG